MNHWRNLLCTVIIYYKLYVGNYRHIVSQACIYFYFWYIYRPYSLQIYFSQDLKCSSFYHLWYLLFLTVLFISSTTTYVNLWVFRLFFFFFYKPTVYLWTILTTKTIYLRVNIPRSSRSPRKTTRWIFNIGVAEIVCSSAKVGNRHCHSSARTYVSFKHRHVISISYSRVSPNWPYPHANGDPETFHGWNANTVPSDCCFVRVRDTHTMWFI
jgi:hypothetical protein